MLSLAALAASPGGQRFVFVILRDGLDGLSAVPAIRDPDFAAARGPLAQFANPALGLDATFALHPALAQLHVMYGRGEPAVAHATGLSYRECSHFDAQQVLESRGPRPFETTPGWLGHALAVQCAVAASSRTGPAWRSASASKAATCAPRPTCARC